MLLCWPCLAQHSNRQTFIIRNMSIGSVYRNLFTLSCLVHLLLYYTKLFHLSTVVKNSLQYKVCTKYIKLLISAFYTVSCSLSFFHINTFLCALLELLQRRIFLVFSVGVSPTYIDVRMFTQKVVNFEISWWACALFLHSRRSTASWAKGYPVSFWACHLVRYPELVGCISWKSFSLIIRAT